MEEREHKKMHLLYISLGLEKFHHPQMYLKGKIVINLIFMTT